MRKERNSWVLYSLIATNSHFPEFLFKDCQKLLVFLIDNLQSAPILTSPPPESSLTDILVRKPSSSSAPGELE